MENFKFQRNQNKVQSKIRKMSQQNITKYFSIDANRNASRRDGLFDSYEPNRESLSNRLEPPTIISTMSSYTCATTSDTNPKSSKTSINRSRNNTSRVKYKSNTLPQYKNDDHLSYLSSKMFIEKYCATKNANQEHSEIRHGPFCKCKSRYNHATNLSHSLDNKSKMDIIDLTTRVGKKKHGPFCKCNIRDTYSSHSLDKTEVDIKDLSTRVEQKNHGPFCKYKSIHTSRHQNNNYIVGTEGSTSDNYSEMIKGPTTSFEKSKCLKPLFESKIHQLPQYEKNNYSSNTSDNEPEIARTTSTTNFGKENVTPRTRRAPNEIRSASMICPILILDPAKEDLRRTLNRMGIYRNYLRDYGFNVTLAETGEYLAKKYVSGEEENYFSSSLLRMCMYCDFRFESRLALGYHLDVKHKNKLKKWSYSQRPY